MHAVFAKQEKEYQALVDGFAEGIAELVQSSLIQPMAQGAVCLRALPDQTIIFQISRKDGAISSSTPAAQTWLETLPRWINAQEIEESALGSCRRYVVEEAVKYEGYGGRPITREDLNDGEYLKLTLGPVARPA